MNTKIKIFLKDKYVISVILFSIISLLFSIAIFYIFLAPFQNNIIIHHDIQNRIDLYGTNTDLIMILLSTLIIIIINLYISYELYVREKVLSYVVLSSIFMISFFGSLLFYFLHLFN